MAGEKVVEKTDEQQLETELNITPEVPAEVKKTPEELETERIAAEETAKKLAEDPEFDLGLDDKQQPLKFKKSQILEFQKNQMLNADYTKKTQELAAERANLKEVVEIIEYLKKNPKRAEKIVAILEAKEEEAKEEEFDLKKAIDEIDTLLKDLPEDDPYAKALRSQRGIIQHTLKVNQQLQQRLDQLDKSKVSETESKLLSEADQTLQGVIASTQKALEFTDADEAADWKEMTLMYLVNSPKEYSEMDAEQFKVYFKGIADKTYAKITKIGEKHVAKYIKSKTGGPGVVTETGGKGGVLPAAPNADNLQGSLEKMLEEESNKT